MSKPPSQPAGGSRRAELLNGRVGPTLLRLAGPMVLGIAAIMLFQIADTYYVGRLGPSALAAMSFTFPVTFIVFSVAMGLGIGTTSAIARAIGTGDEHKVKVLTTHALTLSVCVVSIVGVIGLLSLDPIFHALGASDDSLVLIRQYMVPWLMGVGLLVIPMVGNSAIRATGDTRTPSIVMMIA